MENSFDEKAKLWDSDPPKIERAYKTFLTIKEMISLNNNFSCMEFGCGTGILSFFFQPYVKKIDLVDTSSGMLEVLNGKIKASNVTNMNPIFTDIMSAEINQLLPKYDLIYSLMAMHHVVDYEELIKRLCLLLNTGGHLFMADLVTEDGSFHGLDSGFDGHNGFSKNELETSFSNGLLEVIDYRNYYEIEKATRKYPLFIINGRKN